MVRFIHAADLHLDSPFIGLSDTPNEVLIKIQDSTFQSFRNIVQLAIQRQVDFVLIAGDIFDIDDRSVKAQVQFNDEMKKLNEHDIPAYIIHGNHDYLADESAYLELPENAFTFGTEVETKTFISKNNEQIKISGFSYKDQHIWERKIQNYPQKDSSVDYHIGLLHGNQEGASSAHGDYAPFSVSELKQLQYDYFALGHIHKRQKIHPSIPAYYSGNTQGRHRNELGGKGCYLVEDQKGYLSPEFIETGPIQWKNIKIIADNESNLTDLFELIGNELKELEKQSVLVYLDLHISQDLSENIVNKLTVDELNAAFSRIKDDTFLWITKVNIEFIKEQDQILPLKKMFPAAWDDSMNEMLNKSSFEEFYKELYGQVPNQFLDSMHSKKYKEEIIEDASRLLDYLIDT